MKITKHTPLTEVIYFMTTERWSQIIEQVSDQDIALQGWQSIKSYTLGEFIELSNALEKKDLNYIISIFFAKMVSTTKDTDIVGGGGEAQMVIQGV